jgi:hypothetical protein
MEERTYRSTFPTYLATVIRMDEATNYVLDGRGTGLRFPAKVLELTQRPTEWVTRKSFPWDKVAGE